MSTPSRAQVAKVLRLAGDMLDRHGWRQGVADESDGRLTANEAIVAAVVGYERVITNSALTDDELALFRPARRAVLHAIGPGEALLGEWNDTKGRTVDEVQALLAKAASRLERTAETGGDHA